MSRNCGVQASPSSPAIRWRSSAHRLADQRLGRAERGQRRPVGADLERGGEARVPGVGDVGRADQARVVGEQDGEAGLGAHRLAGRRQVEAQAAVEGGVDREQATSRVVLTSSIITTQPSRIACTNAESTSAHLPAGAGERHVVVAEEVLVRGRAGLHLDEAVERAAVALADRPAAAGPQAVGDRARDLALAGAGRPDQPQERRPGRVVHVQQRAGQLVDRLAVQPRRVDPPAVGQHDRLAPSRARARAAPAREVAFAATRRRSGARRVVDPRRSRAASMRGSRRDLLSDRGSEWCACAVGAAAAAAVAARVGQAPKTAAATRSRAAVPA